MRGVFYIGRRCAGYRDFEINLHGPVLISGHCTAVLCDLRALRFAKFPGKGRAAIVQTCGQINLWGVSVSLILNKIQVPNAKAEKMPSHNCVRRRFRGKSEGSCRRCRRLRMHPFFTMRTVAAALLPIPIRRYMPFCKAERLSRYTRAPNRQAAVGRAGPP